MSDVTIGYNGSTIATMNTVGSIKLLTKNTICDGNILISFVPPSPTRSVEVSYNGNVIASLTESGTKTLLVDEKYCNNNLLVNYKTSLPPEYREVEYLASSGTQYINLGFIPTNNTDFSCKLAVDSPADTPALPRIFGGYTNASKRFEMYLVNNSSSTYRGIAFNYLVSTYFSYFVPTVGEPFTMSKTGTTFVAGTATTTLAATAMTGDANFWLFATNRSGTDKFTGKVYSMTISDTSQNLSMNLVPCIRTADNEPGMFDLVSGTFFTNSGTGEFTPGGAI